MAEEKGDVGASEEANGLATNARALSPDFPKHGAEVEGRIQVIMQAMRDLQWRRGKSQTEYAERWNISEQRVRELSAEASKRVRAEYEDPDRAVVSVYTTLEAVMADGASSQVPGEKAAAVAAARLMAELAGMGAEKKQPTAPTRLIVEMREPVSAFDDEVGAIEPKLDRGE